MNDHITLLVNAGSSSIKAAFYSGLNLSAEANFSGADSGQLVQELLNWASKQPQQANVIGHRIVHGGALFQTATKIDEDVRGKLESLASLDPEHLPTALNIIDSLNERMPDVPQIACFDTAFFHGLPRVAQIIPLPRELESLGLRKYGFHGLSYQSLLDILKNDYSVDVGSSRIICAHLGSGASLAAIKNGVPLDTTMSLTPTSGIPMSTRSGDVDPGVVEFLHKQRGISSEEFYRIATTKSGLLGISETSADMHALLEAQETDIRAKEAIDVFCYDVKKAIGSLSAVLGGVDVLVFSGGIGEKAPKIRKQICEGLEYLGIKIDDQNNNNNQSTLHDPAGSVAVYALHTAEELTMVKLVHEYLQAEE